jgi:hypothetical protein
MPATLSGEPAPAAILAQVAAATPKLAAERERIGLLGRIASIVCLIELYSGAPSDDDAITCLGKLIAFRQQRQREADKEREALKRRLEKEKPGQEPPTAKPFVSPPLLDHRCPPSGGGSFEVRSDWKDARRIGRTEADAQAVLTVFRVRGIVVPDAMRERILAEKDPAQLERWHERAILAVSVAEVFDEATRAA